MRYLSIFVFLLFVCHNTGIAQKKHADQDKNKIEEVAAKGKKEIKKAKYKKNPIANKKQKGKQNIVDDLEAENIKEGKERVIAVDSEVVGRTKKKKLATASNKGNAYGKKKKELTGKEFGEKRASEAKIQNLKKKKELDVSVDRGRSTVKKAKDKIALAKDILKAEKTANKISEEEYTARKARIELVEQKMKSLEQKISKSK